MWNEEPRRRHSYFGVASTEIARLSVTTDTRRRDVAVTPWNGAWVVIAPGTASTLRAHDATGAVRDELTTP